MFLLYLQLFMFSSDRKSLKNIDEDAVTYSVAGLVQFSRMPKSGKISE
jgi:hypothetical protein